MKPKTNLIILLVFLAGILTSTASTTEPEPCSGYEKGTLTMKNGKTREAYIYIDYCNPHLFQMGLRTIDEKTYKRYVKGKKIKKKSIENGLIIPTEEIPRYAANFMPYHRIMKEDSGDFRRVFPRRSIMPWFGSVKNGSGWIAIMETEFDAQFECVANIYPYDDHDLDGLVDDPDHERSPVRLAALELEPALGRALGLSDRLGHRGPP